MGSRIPYKVRLTYQTASSQVPLESWKQGLQKYGKSLFPLLESRKHTHAPKGSKGKEKCHRCSSSGKYSWKTNQDLLDIQSQSLNKQNLNAVGLEACCIHTRFWLGVMRGVVIPSDSTALPRVRWCPDGVAENRNEQVDGFGGGSIQPSVLRVPGRT